MPISLECAAVMSELEIKSYSDCMTFQNAIVGKTPILKLRPSKRVGSQLSVSIIVISQLSIFTSIAAFFYNMWSGVRAKCAPAIARTYN
jgi:hypothetical protein